MYVCICKAVTDSDIRRQVSLGETDYQQARKALDMANQCGKCSFIAKQVFNEALADQVDASLFYKVG